VQNIGIGGERTDQALKRLERDVITSKPDLVTVMYGTDDSWVDNGKTESRITAEAYEANLREIVARLQKAGIQVVLMTEPMFGAEHRKNGAGEEAEPAHRSLHGRVYFRKIAKDTTTPLVDHFGHWAAVQKRKIETASLDHGWLPSESSGSCRNGASHCPGLAAAGAATGGSKTKLAAGCALRRAARHRHQRLRCEDALGASASRSDSRCETERGDDHAEALAHGQRCVLRVE